VIPFARIDTSCAAPRMTALRDSYISPALSWQQEAL
jgi:hypothetical protein